MELERFRWRHLNPFSVKPIANWKVLYWAIAFSSIGIIVRLGSVTDRDALQELTSICATLSLSLCPQIRSVYRVLEYTQGDHLATHEVYFYMLDTLPLWVSTTSYVFVWPPRVLKGSRLLVQQQQSGNVDDVGLVQSSYEARSNASSASADKISPFSDDIEYVRNDPYGGWRS